MAQDADQRAHAATPRRLEQAREEGQVARSRELTTALLLAAAAAGCFAGGPAAASWLGGMMKSGLSFSRAAAFDTGSAFTLASQLSLQAFWFLVPVLLLLTLIATLAPLVLGGWLFSPKAVSPDLARLSPGRWAGQVFSSHGAIEVAKSVAKAVVISGAALGAVWVLREDLLLLLAGPDADAAARAARYTGLGLAAASGAMLLIAAIDVPAQLWRHYAGLRMSTEEVRREMKESEGDPLLKQKIRSQQREAARRRMMTDVATADVVVTNPTHFAVALAWNEGRMRAPRVVAKGTELVAARIRELAQENGVPVLEAPPLARALHRHADIGDEVPAALYGAVAQLLAWAFAIRAGKNILIQEIQIPEGFDPQS